MARKTVKPEENEDIPAGVVNAPVAEEASVEETDKDSVTVTWRGGSRTYSRAVHGKEFKAYAKEFADKKNGTVA